MTATALAGPQIIYGNQGQLPASLAGGYVPDPDFDAGPSICFQGDALLDPRFWYPKDRVTNHSGAVAAHFTLQSVLSVSAIPAALSASNIASVSGVTSGVALALAAASTGVSVNIPIRVFNGIVAGGTVVTAALALDFGFEFGNCVSGNPTITVANSADFQIGEPLVIAAVGNAAGTAPLLTNVVAIPTATTITVNSLAVPQATNATAAIGTGDLWNLASPPIPLAAQPWVSDGPGLFLDGRQTLARGVRIVGSSGSTGGTFTVRGWDIYGVPMSETITVAAGANTGYGKKAWKYIASVTANFTDNSHTYTVGTTDVFGLPYRLPYFDLVDTTVWANTVNASSTGFTVPDATSPATATTGDVRGTFQVGSTGGGTPITGAANSNGTISSLAMSGNRLTIIQNLTLQQVTQSTISNFVQSFGVTQA